MSSNNNNNNNTQFHKIVVPIDGSENSFHASSLAIDMAAKYGAELLIIHILHMNPNLQALGYYGLSDTSDVAEKYIGAARKEAAPWFERIKLEAQSKNISQIKSEAISGSLSIVGEIANYAEENNADLIVIGSRGRTGFKKMLLGSVASGVITYAPCPVLVVK
jgi:nucleotide-binding universal stress UspA family protein